MREQMVIEDHQQADEEPQYLEYEPGNKPQAQFQHYEEEAIHQDNYYGAYEQESYDPPQTWSTAAPVHAPAPTPARARIQSQDFHSSPASHSPDSPISPSAGTAWAEQAVERRQSPGYGGRQSSVHEVASGYQAASGYQVWAAQYNPTAFRTVLNRFLVNRGLGNVVSSFREGPHATPP